MMMTLTQEAAMNKEYEVTFGENIVGSYDTEPEARAAFDALPDDDVAQIWCNGQCIATRQSDDDNLNLRRS